MVRKLSRHIPTLISSAVGVLLVLSLSGVYPRATMAADELLTTCGTSDLGYTVEVCLTAPAPEARLTDDAMISATVKVSDSSQHVKSIAFEVDGRRALTDFDAPFQFMLPVDYWGNGTWELSAVARMTDKQESGPVTTHITIASGEPITFPQSTFAPTTGRPATPGEPFVVAAIGDSAGGSPQSAAIADLIGSWNPNLMLYLGDVYNSGTYTEFMNWYNPDEFVGRFRDITLPTPGNHEYAGADQPQGYMQYWGDPPHYYSVDVAGWHIISLDSNPKFNETAPNTEQMQWLEQDLASSANACTVVFFHHPPHSVGNYAGKEGDLDDLWRVLANNHVTLLLTGHDHNYQRWTPLNADGQPDPSGTVSLIVGTGGQSEYVAKVEDPRVAGPVLEAPGALRLELNPNGAGLQFITTDGVVQDTSVVPCAGAPADTTPPAAPVDVAAVRELDGTVSVRWSPAADDTGVDHYRVSRNDQVIDDANRGFVSVDTDAGTDAVYRVEAVDAAGNASAPSASVPATGQASPDILFADSFSSGSLARWQTVDGLTTGQSPEDDAGHDGVAWARGSSQAAYALWALPEQAADEFTVSTSFKVVDQGDNPIVFLRLRAPNGDSLGSVNVGSTGLLATYNDVTGNGVNSSQKITLDTWHTLGVSLTGPPGSRVLAVSLDGTPVADLSGPIDLGSGPIGQIQLGDSTKYRVYDVLYDDVVVSDTATLPATTPVPDTTPQAARSPEAVPP